PPAASALHLRRACCLCRRRRLPSPPLFPYTTLFRSHAREARVKIDIEIRNTRRAPIRWVSLPASDSIMTMPRLYAVDRPADPGEDRKSTRLNSSHVSISYAVFCLKKKRKNENSDHQR